MEEGNRTMGDQASKSLNPVGLKAPLAIASSVENSKYRPRGRGKRHYRGDLYMPIGFISCLYLKKLA